MPQKFKKVSADFSYKFFNLGENKVLAITDLNMGHMSVTNDIENVIQDIALREDINPTDYLVVYKDSESRWDGWSWDTNWFLHLGGKTAEEAGNIFINKLKT